MGVEHGGIHIAEQILLNTRILRAVQTDDRIHGHRVVEQVVVDIRSCAAVVDVDGEPADTTVGIAVIVEIIADDLMPQLSGIPPEIDHTHIRAVRECANNFERTVTEHLILLVGKRLRGTYHDGVARVNTNRIDVLHVIGLKDNKSLDYDIFEALNMVKAFFIRP